MKGNISIIRYSSNRPPFRGMSLEITDVSSGVRFLSADLSIEEFGELVSGLGVEFNFELNGMEFVGMKSEHKTEKISIKNDEFTIKDEYRQNELVAPYEVDGWEANRKDFENWRRYNKGVVEVSFHRYIKQD